MIEYIMHGKCKRLDEVPKYAHITAINGREVVGFCEACGKAIFEDTDYGCDSEGIMVHRKCCEGRMGRVIIREHKNR